MAFIQLLIVTYLTFQKKWNTGILIGNWVIGVGCQTEKDPELSTVAWIVQKIAENCCPCLYLSIGQVWWLLEFGMIKNIRHHCGHWKYWGNFILNIIS